MTKKSEVVDAREFVTQAEAAIIRDTSLASINELVRRRRLHPVKMFGRNLLRRSEVESFERLKPGPKVNTEGKRNRTPGAKPKRTKGKRKANKKQS